MNSGACAHCGEPLDPLARADRRTCSTRCRVALCRAAGGARVPPVAHPTTYRLEVVATGPTGVTSEKDIGEQLVLWLVEVAVEAGGAAVSATVTLGDGVPEAG
jgi:hypothetical protein